MSEVSALPNKSRPLPRMQPTLLTKWPLSKWHLSKSSRERPTSKRPLSQPPPLRTKAPANRFPIRHQQQTTLQIAFRQTLQSRPWLPCSKRWLSECLFWPQRLSRPPLNSSRWLSRRSTLSLTKNNAAGPKGCRVCANSLLVRTCSSCCCHPEECCAWKYSRACRMRRGERHRR